VSCASQKSATTFEQAFFLHICSYLINKATYM